MPTCKPGNVDKLACIEIKPGFKIFTDTISSMNIEKLPLDVTAISSLVQHIKMPQKGG
jgi:hypothetical protein